MAAAAISKSVLPVALLLILATAISQAHALSIGGTEVTVLDVVGKVFCSPDGNACPTCRPLVNAKVNVLNKDTKAVIATTITAEDGSFKATVSTSAVVKSIISLDKVVGHVPLPVTGVTCPILDTATGLLKGAVLSSDNAVEQGRTLGKIQVWTRVTA